MSQKKMSQTRKMSQMSQLKKKTTQIEKMLQMSKTTQIEKMLQMSKTTQIKKML
jgi:hypothetical protein